METIEYVDPQTGMAYLDEYDTPTPRRTRHVYHGLEVVQEDRCCDGEAGACGTGIPSCSESWQLAREIVWGDGARFPELIAMVDYTGAGGATNCNTGNPPTGCVYHYLRDILGSVIGLTAANGLLVERYTLDTPRGFAAREREAFAASQGYTYDPYGRTLIESRDRVGLEICGAHAVLATFTARLRCGR